MNAYDKRLFHKDLKKKPWKSQASLHYMKNCNITISGFNPNCQITNDTSKSWQERELQRGGLHSTETKGHSLMIRVKHDKRGSCRKEVLHLTETKGHSLMIWVKHDKRGSSREEVLHSTETKGHSLMIRVKHDKRGSCRKEVLHPTETKGQWPSGKRLSLWMMRLGA